MEIQKVDNLFAKANQTDEVDELDETDEMDEADQAEETDATQANVAQAQGDSVEVSQTEVTADTVQSIMDAKVASLKMRITDPKVNAELTKLLNNFDSEKFMKDFGSQIKTTAEATALLYFLYLGKYDEMDADKK